MTQKIATHRHHVDPDTGHRFTLHVERHLARSHGVRIATEPDPPLDERALAAIHDVIHTFGITTPVSS